MPQLDTSTWFTTISSMFLTLFIMFQLKVSEYTYYPNLESTRTKMQKQSTPWETKWMKIYLPLS